MRIFISKYPQKMSSVANRHNDGIIIERMTSEGSIYYYADLYNSVRYIIDDFNDDEFISMIKQYRYLGYAKLNNGYTEYITYFHK